MKHLLEKHLSTHRIYDGRMINLRVDTVILPSGKEATREVVEHPGAVSLVALTDQRELIMVRQYRKPIDLVTLEIPAGKLDRGEDPAACARRELQEETGCTARELVMMFKFYTTPGFSDEIMYLYLARGLETSSANPDEDEFLEVEKVPLDKALAMISSGEICDSKTIIGVLAAQTYEW